MRSTWAKSKSPEEVSARLTSSSRAGSNWGLARSILITEPWYLQRMAESRASASSRRMRSYADAPVPMGRGHELGVFHLGSTVVVMTPPECTLDTELAVGASIRVGQVMARGALNER